METISGGVPQTAARELRVLYCIEEDWPTYRADVRTLFSDYLPRYGVRADLVALEVIETQVTPTAWKGGSSFLFRKPHWKILVAPLKLFHIVITLLTAQRGQYFALQIRDMPIAAFFAVFVSRLKGLPLVYWMSYAMPESQIALARERGFRRGLYFFGPLVKGLLGQALLYRIVLPRCRHIFVQSERMATDLRNQGISVERMTPVPMGVDLERANRAKIAPSNDKYIDGKRVVVYLGTLHRSRRIELLLDMIVLVAKKIDNVVLVVVGDIDESSHREWLKNYAAEHGAEGLVQWKGWQTAEAAWGYLRRAEVGLSPFPRSFELDSCSPTKVIEYLAFGVPVVGNDQPEQEKVIRESGGGFCVSWSAEAFCNAVVQLLEDAGLRRTMGDQGSAFVARNRDYGLIASKVAQEYRDLFGSERAC